MQLETAEGDSKVKIEHFLSFYNPVLAPHILETTISTNLGTVNPTTKHRHSISGLSLVKSNIMDNSSDFVRDSSDIIKRPYSANNIAKAKSFDVNSELKKLWQVILRDCQRLDIERTGFVSREVFYDILDKSSLTKVNSLILLVWMYSYIFLL